MATVAQLTAQLQESFEAKKRLREQYVRFIAMNSHEFHNPLVVFETQASLLQREIKAGIENTDKRIGIVRAAAQRPRLALWFDGWFEDLVGKCHDHHANHSIDYFVDGPIGTIYAD